MIRDVLRDSSVYGVSAILARGLAFLIVPLYSRLLSPTDYAALDLIATAGVLVTLVVPLEVGQGMAREWADASDDEARRRLAATALAFTAAAYAIALALALPLAGVLAAWWIGSSDYASALAIGLVQMAANGVFLQLLGQFRWARRPQAYGAISVLNAALALGLGVLGSQLGGLNGVLAGQALAAAASGGARLATSASAWPLAGSCTVKRARGSAPQTQAPPIRLSVLSSVGSASRASGEVGVSIVGSGCGGTGTIARFEESDARSVRRSGRQPVPLRLESG